MSVVLYKGLYIVLPMSNLMMADSTKSVYKVREIAARAKKWAMKFKQFESEIDKQFGLWVQERNGDLPTILDLKRKVFPELGYSDSYLSVFYSVWLYYCLNGNNPKYKIIQEAFIAPK